jgi:hypothetical protein
VNAGVVVGSLVCPCALQTILSKNRKNACCAAPHEARAICINAGLMSMVHVLGSLAWRTCPISRAFASLCSAMYIHREAPVGPVQPGVTTLLANQDRRNSHTPFLHTSIASATLSGGLFSSVSTSRAPSQCRRVTQCSQCAHVNVL